jgi:hypothetical protein
MKRVRFIVSLALACAAVVVAGGCGGSGGDPSARAEPASAALLTAIASRQQDGVGMVPVRGVVVRSGDFDKVYFVAMEFTATGIDHQVGVWATNDPSGAGTIFSIDGTALSFTDWGDGGTTDAGMSMNDDGAQEALDALK